MRLITDILREIRKGRPVEEATTALADAEKKIADAMSQIGFLTSANSKGIHRPPPGEGVN